MAELKTKPTNQDPKEFLNSVQPEQRRLDSLILLDIFQRLTGEKPVMWGSSIVGFGQYHYKSERSSQEGDWPLVGFSPRKQNLSLYILPGYQQEPDLQLLLQKLGKHKTSVGCLYINKLSDVDKDVLEEIIKKSHQLMKKRFAES
jgi:hypothetical protein